MCNKGGGVAANQEEVWDLLNGTYPNLSEYYRTCSYNRTWIDLADNRTTVVGPIDMPCGEAADPFAGISKWTVTSCQGYNPYGWFNWVERYATGQLGMDLSLYNHRVMIMPKLHQDFMESFCDWSGISTTGSIAGNYEDPSRYRYSYTWFAGDTWRDPLLWFHELGHALWLQHANTPGCEYCDVSSAMGAMGGYGFRCYNAPQNFQLGWGSPFVLLTRDELARAGPGVDVKRWIPLAAATPDHALRLALAPSAASSSLASRDASGVPASCTAQLWVSYRTSTAPYDMPWGQVGSGALLVHRWDGGSFGSLYKPTLEAALNFSGASVAAEAREGAYELSDCRVVVRGEEVWNRYALVSVCVKTGDEDHETDCGDGLDNDCDGLVDARDPDCRGGLRVARPPRPPPAFAGEVDDHEKGAVVITAPGLIYEGLVHIIFGKRPPPPGPPPAPPPPPVPRPRTAAGSGPTRRPKGAAAVAAGSSGDTPPPPAPDPPEPDAPAPEPPETAPPPPETAPPPPPPPSRRKNQGRRALRR